MKQWLYLAPVAALAATGCFASKSDIVLLQDEIRSMRASQMRSDSARKLQQDSAIMLTRRTMDSVRSLSQRFGAFQANVNGELFDIGKQLITLQELAGMSSRRITDLRAELENRSQTPVPPGDSAAPPAPGPAQMFQLSYDLLRRGSYSAARAGFEICSSGIPLSMRHRPPSCTSRSPSSRSSGPPRRIRCMALWSRGTPAPRMPRRHCTSTGCRSNGSERRQRPGRR
jgi:TolA-binding protein